MRLTVIDLRAIADTLEQLSKVHATVNSLRVGSYDVNVMRTSNQMDGDEYVVTGLEHNPQSTLRKSRPVRDDPQA